MMDRCEGRRGGLPIVSEVARQNCWSCTTFCTMSVEPEWLWPSLEGRRPSRGGTI